MRIRTIKRHKRGVQIVVEHGNQTPIPKRESLIIEIPEHAEVTGFGRTAARIIKQAAADYLYQWEQLNMRERFAVLLCEAKRDMQHTDEDVVAVAKHIAEHGADHSVDHWTYAERDRKAHDRWSEVIAMSDLVQGHREHFRYDRTEEKVKSLQEAGVDIPEELQRAYDLRTKPLIDPAEYNLGE